MKYKVIIDNLTPEEKVRLITGKNVWETYPIERLNIPSVFMADGPHGFVVRLIRATWESINHILPPLSFQLFVRLFV